MKGGFNKLIRNIVAGASDTEFEKRLTKATFHLDNKEPKEKHVIYLLECMNGEHKEDVSPVASLKFIFERHVANLDNWAINTKVLVVFHRGLQNIKVNRKIYKELKEKENLLHPYQPKNKGEIKYETKMIADISRLYANYIKLYTTVANKTDILSKGMQKISEEVRSLRTSQILKNGDYFEELMSKIFAQFTNADFCRQTRLFSNLIFMLFKDLIKIYKVYYVHITEILERFASLKSEECKKAFEMYQNFVKLTEVIKSKANKLVYQFNFPIQLPDFYNPEKELVETLRVVCEQNDTGAAEQIAKKVRGGMNRDQFKGAGIKAGAVDTKNQDDDGDKEYYFDCKILDKLDTNQQKQEEIKTDGNIDLMDFISKSDFSTVGGKPKPADNFDFDSYNNPAAQQAQPTNDAQPGNNGGVIDLMDIFGGSSGAPEQQMQTNQPKANINLDDLFSGTSAAPVQQQQQPAQADFLGGFYNTQQPQNQFAMQQPEAQQQPASTPFDFDMPSQPIVQQQQPDQWTQQQQQPAQNNGQFNFDMAFQQPEANNQQMQYGTQQPQAQQQPGQTPFDLFS